MMAYALAMGCGIVLLAILGTTIFAALKPLWLERPRELGLVALLLGALAIVKCLLLPLFPGYPQDIFQFLLWGEVMTRGPWHVYDPNFVCRYMPGYLYALWAAVAPARQFYFGPEVTDASTSALGVLIRTPPIIADFLLGLTVYAWLRVVGVRQRGLGGVLLFALNPALNFTSVAWGQNDSALTLPVMLALLMVSQGNYALAAGAAALAVLIKLQGLIVLPIIGIWILLHGRVRDWMLAALAFLATVVIAIAPFQVERPWDFLAKVIASSADYFPYTSLNAFNLMALVAGMRVRDSTTLLGVSAFRLGLLLMAALYLVAVFVLWRERSSRALLYAAFLAYLGFFVLPTRIHERYLYFALALLTPLALDSWATIAMFATLTVTFLVNQVVTLRFLNHTTTLPQHDAYANTIACINLIALAVAIAYGLFLVSKDRARWPRPLRSFFEPFERQGTILTKPKAKARVRSQGS
jgi:dolichyl-phosphate-mannose-protein mannosyltransferase